MKKTLAISVVFLMSCQTPAIQNNSITVCVSDPANGGIQCSFRGEPRYIVPFEKTENFICLPAESARTVLSRPRANEQ